MYKEKKDKIKYFLYARKSQESEDRQIQSLEDQVSVLKDLARRTGGEIVHIYTESKTAKKPHCRPLFAEMLERLERGEASGILCWQINRLSRNPIDSGTLSWMLQQGVLQCIQTIDKQYLQGDNVLLFSVESGMANQYIIDLRKNVERGMRGKADRGWFPAMAPIGYFNEKLEHTIQVDPKRFPLIRKMWDMLLSEAYRPQQIRDIANNEWALTTHEYKRLGGSPLSNSVIYKMFSNIFYTGMFQWGNKLYQGNHNPMITMDEYDRAQIILGKKGKPRPKTHEFAFTGIIACGVCGSMYTATEKTKLSKTRKELKTYTYYHCSHRKKGSQCLRSSQKPISLEVLEEQIEEYLEKITILPVFNEWSIEMAEEENNRSLADQTSILKNQMATREELEKEINNLSRMRYRELIDEEFFISEREVLKTKLLKLNHQIGESSRTDNVESTMEFTRHAFHFATSALRAFSTGTLIEKREILLSLGSNFRIVGKKLLFDMAEWLIPIKENYPSLEAEYKRFELEKSIGNEEGNAVLLAIHTRWRATVQEVTNVTNDKPDKKYRPSNLPIKIKDLPPSFPSATSEYHNSRNYRRPT